MNRPYPPRQVLDSIEPIFLPAPELEDWIQAIFIKQGGALQNTDHAHLQSARIACLWTNEYFTRGMMSVSGQAEFGKAPNTLTNKWAKARYEQQLREWFGELPDFIHTYYAFDAAESDDASWCALVDHECYHCAQALKLGVPQFSKTTGKPKFAIRRHEYEQFGGVTRRFGANASGVTGLIEAAKSIPLISSAKIALACGTCALRSA